MAEVEDFAEIERLGWRQRDFLRQLSPFARSRSRSPATWVDVTERDFNRALVARGAITALDRRACALSPAWYRGARRQDCVPRPAQRHPAMPLRFAWVAASGGIRDMTPSAARPTGFTAIPMLLTRLELTGAARSPSPPSASSARSLRRSRPGGSPAVAEGLLRAPSEDVRLHFDREPAGPVDATGLNVYGDPVAVEGPPCMAPDQDAGSGSQAAAWRWTPANRRARRPRPDREWSRSEVERAARPASPGLCSLRTAQRRPRPAVCAH